MTISIIINTKNEQDNIANALKSILEQTFSKEKMEVIVVDNSSIDKTKEIASKFGVQVYNHGPERSAQKNKGVEKSSGKYLFFMDADMILSPGVAAEAVQMLDQNLDLSGLYLNEKIIGQGLWAKVRDFERSFYSATVIDAVRIVRRDSYNQVEGFDESLTGPEDWDFDKKIRSIGMVNILKTVVYHNESKVSLTGMLAKKKYYTQGFDAYKQKWGNDADVQKQFGFWYRYARVFTENGKWKKVLAHPVQFVLVILSKILVGMVYLKNK
jgi:glycosyltransferase involved in cell wall biosynthesis